MRKITVAAKVENLPRIQEVIEDELEAAGAPVVLRTRIVVAAEEIFVNIAHYAYSSVDGNTTVRCGIPSDPPRRIQLEFIDDGIPYNPLVKPDPDLTLDTGARPIGGLGIFIAKKLMDRVKYQRENGQNRLLLEKLLP